MVAYRYSFKTDNTEDWAIRHRASIDEAATKQAVEEIWPDIWKGRQVTVIVYALLDKDWDGSAAITRLGVEMM